MEFLQIPVVSWTMELSWTVFICNFMLVTLLLLSLHLAAELPTSLENIFDKVLPDFFEKV